MIQALCFVFNLFVDILFCEQQLIRIFDLAGIHLILLFYFIALHIVDRIFIMIYILHCHK